MNTKRLFLYLAILAGVSVSGCGGGGSAGPTPKPPVNEPCIQTAALGCISSARHEQESKRIATRHAESKDFSNQWGLAAIKADQAYAHLKFAK